MPPQEITGICNPVRPNLLYFIESRMPENAVFANGQIKFGKAFSHSIDLDSLD
jgi:hypothetical protein